MTISEWKTWRKAKGMSQAAAAQYVGYSIQAVQAWEQGRRTFPGDRIRLILAGRERGAE